MEKKEKTTTPDNELLEMLKGSIESRDRAIFELRSDESLLRQVFSKVNSCLNDRFKNNKQVQNEIFNDSLIVFYTKVIENIFEGRSSIRTFIVRISHYKALEYNRKYTGKIRFEDPVEFEHSVEEHPERLIIKAEEQEIIQNIIDNLPLKCKEIIMNYYCEGKTIKEVAQEIGLAESSTKALKAKCKEQLENMIRKNAAANEIMNIMFKNNRKDK